MQHLIRAFKAKLNELDSNEALVLARTLLRYAEAFELDNPLDLTYKQWVIDRIGESAEANTFVGFFDTFPELEAVPEEDIPDGGYAFVGVDEERTIYYWNESLGEWYNPFGLTAIRTTVYAATAGASNVFTLEFVAGGVIEVNVGSEEIYPANFVLDGDEVTVTHAFAGGEAVKITYFKSIVTGQRGAEGKSAYEVAVEEGFVGTESEWLESLKGADGTSVTILGTLADESELPPVGDVGDGYIIGDDLYVWNPLLGDWQNVGPIRGPQGIEGKSAYQSWIDLGNVGTESDFIADLKGTQGLSAYEVAQLNGYVGTESEWLESLKGADGVVDFTTSDPRYLRKDQDDATTKTISFGKIKLTTTAEDPVFTHVLGYKDDGSVVLVNPSMVVGDKGRLMLVEVPAVTWILDHGLNKFVGFKARDTAGNPLYPSWDWPTPNQLVLTMPYSVAGDVAMY